jgi:hypothetical protein
MRRLAFRRLAQTDARSPAIFRNELDAGLFEGVRYCEDGILRNLYAPAGFCSLYSRNR